jgi:hypothetical protein
VASDALPEVAAKLGAAKGKVNKAKAVGVILAEKAKRRGHRACRIWIVAATCITGA